MSVCRRQVGLRMRDAARFRHRRQVASCKWLDGAADRSLRSASIAGFSSMSCSVSSHPLGKIREKFARIMELVTETAFAAQAAGRRAAASAAGRSAG